MLLVAFWSNAILFGRYLPQFSPKSFLFIGATKRKHYDTPDSSISNKTFGNDPKDHGIWHTNQIRRSMLRGPC